MTPRHLVPTLTILCGLLAATPAFAQKPVGCVVSDIDYATASSKPVAPGGVRGQPATKVLERVAATDRKAAAEESRKAVTRSQEEALKKFPAATGGGGGFFSLFSPSDAEKGTADNVFTRIGNYDYTNIRAKSRYAPQKNISFNLSFISRDNANPSEIAGVSLNDFGVSVKTRVFTSDVDWTLNSKFSINTGYNYNWLNSNAVVNYFFNNIQHPEGRSLYYVRNNFFFIDTTAMR